MNSKTMNKMKILWVEDDYFHLKGLLKPLKGQYQILTAESYVEAVELVKKHKHFDLILLDLIIPYSQREVVMPKHGESEYVDLLTNSHDLVENGIALFDYIIKSILPNPQIIILSIVQNEKIVEDLIQKGAIKKIPKLGILPKELKEIVEDVLGQNLGEK